VRGRRSEVVWVRGVASSLLWAGKFHARRCGWVRDSSPFSLSLVAKVSRYYHQDTALRLLLGQLPPTCAGFSEPIYLYIPAPCMHAARALLFLLVHAGNFLRSLLQYAGKFFALVITSIISRRARMYVLYMCAHTHTFAPPASVATHGSPLLGVGWTFPESLTLRAIPPRLPELKIRTRNAYGAT
jgi:hypothetical protein